MAKRKAESETELESPRGSRSGAMSATVPRRAAGTRGCKPPNYPDLNFQQIGAALRISPTYVGRILNGVSQPSMRVAERMAAYMGWSIDQLNALYKRKKQGGEDQNGKSLQT